MGIFPDVCPHCGRWPADLNTARARTQKFVFKALCVGCAVAAAVLLIRVA